jgi:hypothetical protein
VKEKLSSSPSPLSMKTFAYTGILASYRRKERKGKEKNI